MSFQLRVKTAVGTFFLFIGSIFISSCFQPLIREPDSWIQLVSGMDSTSKEVRIPIEEIPSDFEGVPFAGVRVLAKNHSLLLFLDTGTSLTLLRNSLRDIVRPKPHGETRLTQHRGALSDHRLYSTSMLRLGEFRLEEETIAFLPDSKWDELTGKAGMRIDGILGATLLRRGEVEIDSKRKLLILRPFEQAIAHLNRHALPLIYIAEVNGYAIPLDSENGQRGRFLLDTGTNASLIISGRSPLADEIKKSGKKGRWNYRTFRGTRSVHSYELPFSLGSSTISFSEGSRVFVEDREDRLFDGILGIPIVWDAKRVILNSQSELAIFGSPTDLASSPL